jgi:hypothetical protein
MARAGARKRGADVPGLIAPARARGQAIDNGCRFRRGPIVILASVFPTTKGSTMRYTLFLHYPELSEQLSAEALQAGMDAFQAYAAALHEAAALVSAEVLQPSSSTTTVRVRDGELQVQDGPYIDSTEQVGGTFVLEVADLDAALEWARRAPSAQWGAVEIRPTAVRWAEGAWTA